MEHFRLLAFLAVCFAAAARADPEPITTPFIPCKALPPLKLLNLTQLTGNWVTQKLYALNEKAAEIGLQVAKPGNRCTQQEILGVNGLSLQLAVVDSKTGTRNQSSCSINRSVHGLWTCSPIGKGAFDVVVVMSEPKSFMLVASACVGAKNYPGLESYGADRFAVVLWLFQKKDSAPLTAEKMAQIDQKAAQVLQRQPVQRQIDCSKSRSGDPQGGGQNGYYGGASHLNNQDMNDFEDPDVGLPSNNGQGQGGFVNANDKNKHKHRPTVQFPGENGNRPHVGAEGGSTVLKPGVTYVKPGVTSPQTGGSSHPEVSKLQTFIQNWFKDPRNKKQGHGNNNNFGGQGANGFGGDDNNQNNNLGENDFSNGYGGGQGGNGNYGGVGFRLGGGNNKTEEVQENNGTESVLPSEETVSEYPQKN